MKNTKHRYYGPDCEVEEMAKKPSEIVKEIKEKKDAGNPEIIEHPEALDLDVPVLKKKLFGRPVIDSVVIDNSDKDYSLYMQVRDSVLYAGRQVDSRLPKVTLNKIAQRSSLISELVNLYYYIKFDSDDAFIMYDGVRHNVNVEIVRFLKALLVNHMNPNQEYSQLLSGICQYIMTTVVAGEQFVIPTSVNTESPMQEVVKREIDKFFKQILITHNIPYSEVVEVSDKPSKRKKASKKDDFESAMDVMEIK